MLAGAMPGPPGAQLVAQAAYGQAPLVGEDQPVVLLVGFQRGQFRVMTPRQRLLAAAPSNRDAT